jgi:hypothetical protein
MKKLILASVAVGALIAPAVAANMPAPIYSKAPSPAPIYNWTGLYVDGGFGYGMWTADTTTINPLTGGCVLCVTQTQGGKGWLGTIGGGYDYQFNLLSYNVVIGALGSYDFSSLTGTIQDQTPFFAGTEDIGMGSGRPFRRDSNAIDLDLLQRRLDGSPIFRDQYDWYRRLSFPRPPSRDRTHGLHDPVILQVGTVTKA